MQDSFNFWVCGCNPESKLFKQNLFIGTQMFSCLFFIFGDMKSDSFNFEVLNHLQSKQKPKLPWSKTAAMKIMEPRSKIHKKWTLRQAEISMKTWQGRYNISYHFNILKLALIKLLSQGSKISPQEQTNSPYSNFRVLSPTSRSSCRSNHWH